MRRLWRITAFRWAVGAALWSAVMSLVLFAFVYWQTAAFMEAELAHAIRHELRFAARDPSAATARIETWISEDLHSVHFAGVFAADGARLAGNLEAVPSGLVADGEVHRIDAQVAIAGRRLTEELWSAARVLPDGRTVVVAHDTDEVDRGKATVVRALWLALAPTLILSLIGGALLAERARRRVAATEAAVADLMRGDLLRRLPVGEAGDAFDRLARDVNALLDEIVRLMEEMRGVGDAVAHDLRTPLTRLRARLERTREQAASVAEFRAAIDQGLGWIDQTLGMVTAVLRIGEIENGHRRAAFDRFDLASVAVEAVEFFEPLAEERGVRMTTSVSAGSHAVEGDRDLLFEALSNLLDNALKFTPADGRVEVGVRRDGSRTILWVEGTGPGISPDERAKVFRRFYRAEAARQTEGTGLGLGLVAAVAQLHDAAVVAGDAAGGGCRFELTFRGSPR